MKKTQDFNKLIYQAYGAKDLYDKIGNQIKNVRETMSKHNEFKRLSAQSQFNLCCTICMIATQTSSELLNKLNSKQLKEVFEYSINRKFQKNENRP
jgi:lysyl-tRNA synthetase class I